MNLLCALGQGFTGDPEPCRVMYDDAGFLTMSIISGLVIVAVFAALLWAAVWDGRVERYSRSSRYSSR